MDIKMKRNVGSEDLRQFEKRRNVANKEGLDNKMKRNIGSEDLRQFETRRNVAKIGRAVQQEC